MQSRSSIALFAYFTDLCLLNEVYKGACGNRILCTAFIFTLFHVLYNIIWVALIITVMAKARAKAKAKAKAKARVKVKPRKDVKKRCLAPLAKVHRQKEQHMKLQRDGGSGGGNGGGGKLEKRKTVEVSLS